MATITQSSDDNLIEIRNLYKLFPIYVKGVLRRSLMGYIHAVDNISIDIKKGEILGIAGETGSGKSSLINSAAYTG